MSDHLEVLAGRRDDGAPTVLLDELGAAAFLSLPAEELGYLVDLGGFVNRPPSDPGPVRERHVARYLLSPGQAAELVVAILQAARASGPAGLAGLFEALEALGYDVEP